MTRHRALQFGVFIAGLITPVQLSFDRVDLLLLVGFAFAFVMNEHRATVAILPLRNLAIEIKAALLQLSRGPFAEWRVLRRIICRSGARA